ncbi:MAG: Na+/H+ antiporter subunit E [Sphaerochaetaceae bacterium]
MIKPSENSYSKFPTKKVSTHYSAKGTKMMNNDKKWNLIRFIITAITLYLIWLVFTASLEPFSLITGFFGSVVIAALSYDVFIARHQANLRFFLPRPFFLLLYLGFVIISLYISSIRVLFAVITGKISPSIVHFKTRLRSDLARMVLANSITLTPGTITLDVNDDHLTVHWLLCTTKHGKAAGETIKGTFERMLQRVLL